MSSPSEILGSISGAIINEADGLTNFEGGTGAPPHAVRKNAMTTKTNTVSNALIMSLSDFV